MNVTIDCSSIRTKEDLHRIFAEELQFPQWYGNNLDAMHDCLTSLAGTVRLEHWEVAETALGKYGISAKRVILTAALKNTGLDIII